MSLVMSVNYEITYFTVACEIDYIHLITLTS